MDDSSFTKLELRAPLLYEKCQAAVPRRGWLFCFEINPSQGKSIEPEREQFLGALIFSGCEPQNHQSKNNTEDEYAADSDAGIVQLPAGIYLFSQKRENLEISECVDFAIEQQKDGLWERIKLQNMLYIRFLFEDEKHVTQIFRPVLL